MSESRVASTDDEKSWHLGQNLEETDHGMQRLQVPLKVGQINLPGKDSVLQPKSKSVGSINHIKTIAPSSSCASCSVQNILRQQHTKQSLLRQQRHKENSRQIEQYRKQNAALKDEAEDIQMHVQELTSQAEDYRAKYLEAQQTVEEHKQLIAQLERDNMVLSEEMTDALSKVKKMFQKKLDVLSPLPFELQKSQDRLRSLQKEREILEKSVESVTSDLAESEVNRHQLEKSLLTAKDEFKERSELLTKAETLQQSYQHLRLENDQMQSVMTCIHRDQDDLNLQLNDLVPSRDVGAMQEECSRKIQRAKERNELQRRMLRQRIDVLEVELAQSRALTTASSMDLEELRARMQEQIFLMSDKYRKVQDELRLLKSSCSNEKIEGDSDDEYSTS